MINSCSKVINYFNKSFINKKSFDDFIKVLCMKKLILFHVMYVIKIF